MKTIVLARHGRPEWSDTALITGRELGEWFRGRDAAPIDPGHTPPPELRRIAREAKGFAASPLRRSLESLHLLVPDAIPFVDPVFREVEVPRSVPLPLPLPGQMYSKISRLAWFAGWSPEVESFGEARERARKAAETLIEIAPSSGTLLLVGHGIINGMIGLALRKMGWKGPHLRPRRQWAHGVYQKS
ncbi:MAG TPA: histidine phosphatase family protein [Gemmatimonadales bacterium]|nr:histidine phosphatase family protein [Gemmatimonadales bacterium]